MPKIVTYSDESPAYLQMPDGNEYYSPEADKHQQQGGTWLRRGAVVSWVKDSNYVDVGVAALDNSKERTAQGVFVTMDRRALNRLIRALRDARDGAFGKDA